MHLVTASIFCIVRTANCPFSHSQSKQEWKNIRLIQFLLVPGEEEWLASRGGQRTDLLDDVPPATQDASEPSHGRLSTIVEGTEGSQHSHVAGQDLQRMFEEEISHKDLEPLSQVYASCMVEVGPPLREGDSLEGLKALVLEKEAHMPADTRWSEALQPEEMRLVTAFQVEQASAMRTAEAEELALDSD